MLNHIISRFSLTAGYLLAKRGKPVIVLESTDQVGGIARTEVRDGYRFDLGGHASATRRIERRGFGIDRVSVEPAGRSGAGSVSISTGADLGTSIGGPIGPQSRTPPPDGTSTTSSTFL